MTVVVTGFTADRMLEMEDATVVDGNIVGNDLVLITKDGTNINAGNVRGPQGIPGPGFIICTSITRPSSPAEGTPIYETDTNLIRVWDGTKWRCQERVVCTSSTRPTLIGADEGVKIWETDTNREWIWSGSAWVYPPPRGVLAYRLKIGNSPNVSGAATVVTGLSVSFTAEANRYYEIVLSPRLMGNANGDQGTIRMLINGSNYKGAKSVTCTTAGRAYGDTMSWVVDGASAGLKDVTFTIQLNDGTSIYIADNAEVFVRDLGST